MYSVIAFTAKGFKQVVINFSLITSKKELDEHIAKLRTVYGEGIDIYVAENIDHIENLIEAIFHDGISVIAKLKDDQKHDFLDMPIN